MANESVREDRSTAYVVRDRDLEVKEFVDGLARTVTMGDGRSAVRFWELPAFVISDEGVRSVASDEEVESHFSTAKQLYYARGIIDTQPEVMSLEWTTDRIAIVHVRWPYLNARGDEVGEESMTYTLRRDESGKLRLRVAILHGEASPAH